MMLIDRLLNQLLYLMVTRILDQMKKATTLVTLKMLLIEEKVSFKHLMVTCF